MDQWQPGDPRQIGSYTLLGRLGPGPFGPAFLGRSPGGRSVTVRVAEPGLASDPGFRLRFAREVETASRVGGPFLASVIDADPDALRPWLATGYVPGPSLAEAIAAHGPLPATAVLTLATGLAVGLRAIHQAGVLHGDLEPGNVLLAPDGPRLAGFGTGQTAGYARLVARRPAGAAGFTPPELVPGQPSGTAGDVYALGAVLAFAATGRPPGVAGLLPAGGAGRLPGELLSLVEWCLAVSPAGRPTAEEFLTRLIAVHPRAVADAGWQPEVTLPGGFLAAPVRTAAVSWPAAAAPPAAFAAVSGSAPADGAGPVGAAGPSANPWAPPAPPVPPGVPRRRQGPRLRSALTWRPRLRPRRSWVIAATAVTAAAGIAAGVLAAWPRPSLGQPTALVITHETPWSVTLSWKASVGGIRPSGYQVLEDGRRLATVPPARTSYQVSGLAAKTAYHFSVVAVSGQRATSSATLLADTMAPPPLADATFPWSGGVRYKEVAATNDAFKKVGETWQDSWSISYDCGGAQACDKVVLAGAIEGDSFDATLTRSGLTWKGTAPVDDYWEDCVDSNKYEKTKLLITIVVTQAGPDTEKHWSVSAFTGSATWEIPDTEQCQSAVYQMDVSVPYPYAGG